MGDIAFVPGESLTDWADAVSAALNELRRNAPMRACAPLRIASGTILLDTPPGRETVLVVNASGAAQPAGAVLEITGTAADPAANPNLFFTNPVPTVNVPTANSGGKLVILASPAPVGGTGWAHVSGVCVALVTVGATTHNFADVAAASNQLHSAGSGPVQIIASPGATGSGKLCLVRLVGGRGTAVNPCILPVGSGTTLDTATWSATGGPYSNGTGVCDGVSWTPSRIATGAADTDPLLCITRTPTYDGQGNLVAVSAEASSQVTTGPCAS